MANYSLVANSTFQPFSYQELLAPIMDMSNYHEKLNEEYDKLSSQADILEAMGSDDRDNHSGAYDRYKNYSNTLKKEAEELYKFGLNSESRRRLSDLRRMYNTDIVPIQNAWNKRDEETKMQTAAYMQNPSLMFTRDANKTSLDEYIKNPTGGFGVINGANITAQMATMASNLAKQIRSGHTENIDEYTINHITRHGLDENFIRNWRESKALSKMFEQVMQANGVTPEALDGSLNAQSIIDRSTRYAEMGMWNAMGEDKSQIMEDYGARLNAQMAKEIAIARTKAGEPIDGALPGGDYQLNFNDAESAGNVMKHNLAEATASFIVRNANGIPAAKKILNYWNNHGGIEAAIKHWETNGFNGSEEWMDNKLSRMLTQHLKNTVTDNDEIINIWKSPYGATVTTKPIPKGTPMFSPFEAVAYSKDIKIRVDKPTKDWKNINDLANNGWYVKGVALKDDPDNLNKWLKDNIGIVSTGDKVKLYDIAKISGDGTYQYKEEKLDLSELPQKSDGSIDYSAISRARLSNGDFVLYWIKGNKKIEKILRRSDIGGPTVDDWNNIEIARASAKKMLRDGKIDYNQYIQMINAAGNSSLYNDYLDTQVMEVKPFSVGGK